MTHLWYLQVSLQSNLNVQFYAALPKVQADRKEYYRKRKFQNHSIIKNMTPRKTISLL
jgi:hypothetical protein